MNNIEWAKPILRPKFDERIKKNRIKLCKYYLYIIANVWYMYTGISFLYKESL